MARRAEMFFTRAEAKLSAKEESSLLEENVPS